MGAWDVFGTQDMLNMYTKIFQLKYLMLKALSYMVFLKLYYRLT